MVATVPGTTEIHTPWRLGYLFLQFSPTNSESHRARSPMVLVSLHVEWWFPEGDNSTSLCSLDCLSLTFRWILGSILIDLYFAMGFFPIATVST